MASSLGGNVATRLPDWGVDVRRIGPIGDASSSRGTDVALAGVYAAAGGYRSYEKIAAVVIGCRIVAQPGAVAAAAAGVYAHAEAGDRCMRDGLRGMLALEVAQELRAVLAAIP